MISTHSKREGTAILYLEDIKTDVEIVESYLEEEKIEYELTNVDNRSDFISALEKKQFDIILLDYSLPSFDGLSALAIVKKSYPDIPAIMLSGNMGEERAIETLKAGAIDYVLKQRMSRFIPSLKRAIAEADEQRKRKRAEEQLRESEERYRSTLDNMIEGCQIIGSNWCYLYVNEAVARHGHRAKEELLGHTMMEIYPGIEDTEMFSVLQRCMEKRTSHRLDNEFTFPDGSKGWYDLSIQPVPEGIFILSVDITENKRAEEQLRESEQRLLKAQQVARMGFLDVNLKTNEVYWSDEIYRLYGVNPDELKSSFELTKQLTHPDDLVFVMKGIESVIQGISELDIDHRILRFDGKVLWVHEQAELIRDTDGNPDRIIGTVVDITDRKQAEEALGENEERYRSLVESSDDPIYLVGRNLKYLFANEKLLLRLGKSLNELVGQDYFQFHSPDGTKEFSAMVEKVFKSGKPVNYEHKSHRDGRDFIRTLSPINDPKTKTITAVTIISKDITERKRAAEALWESEEWNKIILNTVMAGVIVVDAETRQIIKINERVVNLIGLPKELIIGNVCHKFICPAEEKNCPVLDLGNIVDCSERVLLKSNQEKADIIKTVVPLTLHNHKYLVESFVDITERKQADEALRENEERYRAVVENSHSGILIVGEDYKFNYINDALCNIFGRRREDIIGHDFKEFLDNDSKSLVADRYLRRQRGEEVPPRYEFNVVRKDGEKRRVEISSTVVRDSQGRARTIAQLLDITERKRSEEQVHYQANLLQNVSDAIIASDKDGIIQIWNPAAEKIYGWKSDEVRGKKFHEIIKPEYHYKSREGVFEKIKADGVWSGEIVHHRKDGQPISILSTISGLKDNSGNQTGLVSVNHDITERKQAEEALKESEAKYRLMVESSRDAIVISQNDRYIFINDAFANMLGYQKADLLMSSYKKVYTEEAIKILEERDKQGSTGEAVADRYETVFKKKDGAEVHVEANVRIIDYKGQKATFAVIRNITKQKEILAALQASIEQSQGLKNFISICAGCNKIRDDEQENRPWVSPADYIVDRLPGIKFSHGMCPDCMKKWYPDYVDKKIVK